MKRTGYIFDRITDIDNIKAAILNASKGKRQRRNVKAVLDNIDEKAAEIREMLINKTYSPKQGVLEVIFDPCSNKEREIYKPRYFPDQIIHWALMLQIEHVIMRGMYQYSTGSVPKRGIHFTLKTVKKWLKEDRKHTKYCLKIDISKFYPNINIAILKGQLRKKFKDQDALWLMDTILDTHEKGLPIGNYTSQWLSNFHLEEFDHFIKEELKIKYYVRYVDDCCFFSNNKRELHRKRKLIEDYLNNNLKLTVKKNWQLFKVDSRGVDFVGYRIFRGYTLLRKSTALRVARRSRKIRKKETMTVKDAQAVASYKGWLVHCNGHNFYLKHIYPLNLKKVRRIIRNESKLNNKTGKGK